MSLIPGIRNCFKSVSREKLETSAVSLFIETEDKWRETIPEIIRPVNEKTRFDVRTSTEMRRLSRPGFLGVWPESELAGGGLITVWVPEPH